MGDSPQASPAAARPRGRGSRCRADELDQGRWISSCRREVLNRTLIWNQRHSQACRGDIRGDVPGGDGHGPRALCAR